ncbi:hypothetical protein FD30_GL002109 [Levilactobacillus namurensis DSM 19117]|uniref:Uncharacterized protein n=1 Tax=Levilactobacillus namurensis DSM 19117 TaxID=1423773 RepID=A0A0R1K6U6_9LACO|nr:hypothetical protein FD30_GL002109 [Levilactobacillus namurensis DSM 19117]
MVVAEVLGVSGYQLGFKPFLKQITANYDNVHDWDHASYRRVSGGYRGLKT